MTSKFLILFVLLSFLTACVTPTSDSILSTTAPSINLTITPTRILPIPTLTPIPKGKTIIVTSIEDSGSGTLRQAIHDAKTGDIITFDPDIFPPEDPSTIFLKNHDEYTVLPIISQGYITIDASNAGVILDGRNISDDWINAIVLESDGNTIQGLQVVNFSGYGIIIYNGSYNVIGGDNSIGTGPTGRGNIISKNKAGIKLCNIGYNNLITGNLIGTDDNETEDWGNRMNGVIIYGNMTHNTIGPDNIIAHNGSVGILIVGDDTSNEEVFAIQLEGSDTYSYSNIITQNKIYNNAFGIRLNGGNAMLPHPLLSDSDLDAGTISGSACANCIIEIFSTNGVQGDVYEGRTKADSAGTFSYAHGTSFTGPFLTATATDVDGNTSEFGQYFPPFQEGNNIPIVDFHPKRSNELKDNKIGILIGSLSKLEPEVFPDKILSVEHILNQGVTRARVAIDCAETECVHWDKPELLIEPSIDEFITTLSDNGVEITLILSFWDKEYVARGGNIRSPRFKTEDEIQRYLDYVHFIVSHFKDRVEYYEIWNEPNIENTIQWIEVEDYINLVKKVVPVIRQEYPEAKIVVGGVSYILEQYVYKYLESIIKSDEIMPLVDVISWHGMYGTSPEYDFHRQYYYDYPTIVQEIKDTASAHGFKWEYISDELSCSTPATVAYPETYYSEIKCAKYYARGIIMHLGMDIKVSQFYAVPNAHPLLIVQTIRNLSTIMAGNKPTEMAIEIQSDATYIKNYGFSLPNGDYLIAVWNDDAAVDYDPGMSATVKIPGFGEWSATGVDTVYGFEQELIDSSENGDLVIHNFLLKDYPIMIHLSK